MGDPAACSAGGTPAVRQKVTEFVSAERYLELLCGLRELAAALSPQPECVIGMKRSGLFPAVFLSHQLELAMLAESEIKSLPPGRFATALIVDTTAWKGVSLRRATARLNRRGITAVQVLAMFGRRDPPPDVPGLRYLESVESIPRFWYE